MVNFMLNNLGCPAGIRFDSGLEPLILELHPDFFVPLRRARTIEQRQTGFFCLVRTGALQNFGIIQHRIMAAIIERNNGFFYADHISRHPYTGGFMGLQRIE